MITRRASEIIRLAETMSQIQNTDALSWLDKMDMLNQSYVRLYDDLNRIGDNYYIKEIDLKCNEHKRFVLPPDFWKLNFVGYRSSTGEPVPLDRAPNAGRFGYKIINNEFIVDNLFTTSRLMMRYIPKPQTLRFPNKGELIGYETNAQYDCVRDAFVFGNPQMITIVSRKEGKRAVRDFEGPYAMALSSGILYVVKENGIYCFDYDFNELSTLPGDFMLYAHKIGWHNGIIVKTQDGQSNSYISGGTLIPGQDTWDYEDGTIARSNGDNPSYIYIGADGSIRDLTDIFVQSESFVIADPYIYINKGGNVHVYRDFEQYDFALAQVGGGKRRGTVLAADINHDTGYGVLYLDYYSGLWLMGYSEDTVLNYPNNIFYDWITTDLAVKFRMALDIPSGELPAILDDYYDTLSKGISRDAYQSPRITNVYQRGLR